MALPSTDPDLVRSRSARRDGAGCSSQDSVILPGVVAAPCAAGCSNHRSSAPMPRVGSNRRAVEMRRGVYIASARETRSRPGRSQIEASWGFWSSTRRKHFAASSNPPTGWSRRRGAACPGDADAHAGPARAPASPPGLATRAVDLPQEKACLVGPDPRRGSPRRRDCLLLAPRFEEAARQDARASECCRAASTGARSPASDTMPIRPSDGGRRAGSSTGSTTATSVGSVHNIMTRSTTRVGGSGSPSRLASVLRSSMGVSVTSGKIACTRMPWA